MKLFNLDPVENPYELAEEKFLSCPWPFFDGVPDLAPDSLGYGDFAITRVMSSGIRNNQITLALQQAKANRVEKILKAIPVGFDIIGADDAAAERMLVKVDALFAALRVRGLAMSRTSKVLCRKRPHCIPMLDNIVTKYLNSVCTRWRADKVSPEWLEKVWPTWDWQPGPYIRMIREDARTHLDELTEIRARLATVRETGVPAVASLLRIWEVIVFWPRF